MTTVPDDDERGEATAREAAQRIPAPSSGQRTLTQAEGESLRQEMSDSLESMLARTRGAKWQDRPDGVACDTRFLENHPDDYVMVGPFPRRDPHDPETRKRQCGFELDAGDGIRLRVRQPDRAPVEARVIEMPTGNTYRVSIVGFEDEEHFEGQTYDVRIGEEVVVGASQMWAMWGAPAEA